MSNLMKKTLLKISGLQWIINVLLIMGVTATLYFQLQSKPHIAYIDTTRLMENYKGMKAARQAYQAKAAVWQTNIATLESEVDSTLKAYEALQNKMTAREKALHEELVQSKQRQLQQYRQAISDKAQQEDMQMTQAVVDEVNIFLSKYGRKQGYDIIMAATHMGNIAFAEEKLDITEEVLAEINKE